MHLMRGLDRLCAKCPIDSQLTCNVASKPLQGMLISREAWKALLCSLLLLGFGMFTSFYVISSWLIKKSLTFIIIRLFI